MVNSMLCGGYKIYKYSIHGVCKATNIPGGTTLWVISQMMKNHERFVQNHRIFTISSGIHRLHDTPRVGEMIGDQAVDGGILFSDKPV